MMPRIDPAAILAAAARVNLAAIFGARPHRRQNVEHRLIQIGARGKIMRVLVITLRRLGRGEWGNN